MRRTWISILKMRFNSSSCKLNQRTWALGACTYSRITLCFRGSLSSEREIWMNEWKWGLAGQNKAATDKLQHWLGWRIKWRNCLQAAIYIRSYFFSFDGFFICIFVLCIASKQVSGRILLNVNSSITLFRRLFMLSVSGIRTRSRKYFHVHICIPPTPCLAQSFPQSYSQT